MEKEVIINKNNCNVYVLRKWLPVEKADELCSYLKEHIEWEIAILKIFGKEHPEPRRTHVMGEKGIIHKYSGVERSVHPWEPRVESIVRTLNEEFKATIDACLLNEYKTGNETIGFHPDKEVKEPRCLVVTISLGGTRRFILKPRSEGKEEKKEVLLNNGDLVIMEGDTQKHWLHSIPRVTRRCTVNKEGINEKCQNHAAYAAKKGEIAAYCEEHKPEKSENVMYRISLTFRELGKSIQ